MSQPIPVIDLFAGPGGLGEGFSSLRDGQGKPLFRIALSIEKDEFAHRTLRLRAFARRFDNGKRPLEYYEHLADPDHIGWGSLQKAFPDEAEEAEREACKLELGASREAQRSASRLVSDALDGAESWVLIGGPPCQAYSVVGRSRRAGEPREDFERDPRHTLYKHYLSIVDEFEPPLFVMENVTGLLSATLSGRRVFDLIRDDFAEAGTHGYSLRSFTSPRDPSQLKARDFVIAAEDYGIPQARHRVILLGVRNGFQGHLDHALVKRPAVTTADVLGGMPWIRSRISARRFAARDGADNWIQILRDAVALLEREDAATAPFARKAVQRLERSSSRIPSLGVPYTDAKPAACVYDWWYRSDPSLLGLTNHQSRAHMPSDIQRYFFCAAFAMRTGRSPVLEDFPVPLLPAHANVAAGVLGTHFADRFRVQVSDAPSTTVTSHISKDGNYYIHYDPTQARSLSVREAARLQTFPDDYFFEGNKTQQYHQVGNAVPPLLARQLGEVVAKAMGRTPERSFPEPSSGHAQGETPRMHGEGRRKEYAP